MKQEVFNRDGKRVFVTEDENCMYDKETAYTMRKAGYEVKVDGKVFPKMRGAKEKSV